VGNGVNPVRILHVSDLHFGRPVDSAMIEAIEDHIAQDGYDVVAISGDVSQRARAGEFQRARVFIRDASKYSRVIVVPGNHDVAWWRSPMMVRGSKLIYEPYLRYVSTELEPVLRVPGATLVGLNTAQGVSRRTLTWNLRDISIIGDIHRSQIDRAESEFKASAEGDARIIVMHHNPVKGELSQRHGLKNTPKVLGAFARIGVDVVLCGHDHQEAIHYVEHTKRGTVVSTAGTVSNRSRGRRPSSVNVVTITQTEIGVHTMVWSSSERTWADGPRRTFQRHAGP